MVDAKTHGIICVDLLLNNVTDSEVFPGLVRQTYRKIRSASAIRGYVTMNCDVRMAVRLSLPEEARVTSTVSMRTATVRWRISI